MSPFAVSPGPGVTALPAEAAAQGGDIQLLMLNGFLHFSPRLQGWSAPRKCPTSPSLHRPRVIVCSPLGRGAFPVPSEASFPFSSWMEPPLALQAAGTILSFGILQSRIHHPRSGLREVFMDSRWQRLSVCPSPPVLPLLPFILLAPRTPLLPLQGPRRCWRYHSDITAQLGWFGVKLALGSSLEKQL